jgi:hypothetical protein
LYLKLFFIAVFASTARQFELLVRRSFHYEARFFTFVTFFFFSVCQSLSSVSPRLAIKHLHTINRSNYTSEKALFIVTVGLSFSFVQSLKEMHLWELAVFLSVLGMINAVTLDPTFWAARSA